MGLEKTDHATTIDINTLLSSDLKSKPTSSYHWKGINITFENWQTQVLEIGLRGKQELEALIRKTLRLRPEELLEEALFIYDGDSPRIVLLTGRYGEDSKLPLQAAFRWSLEDKHVIVRGQVYSKVFDDHPCGPGYNLNNNRYNSFTLTKDNDALTLTRTNKKYS